MVKRYDFDSCHNEIETSDGHYVTHDDYVKLEAERDDFENKFAYSLSKIDKLEKEVDSLHDEIKRSKAIAQTNRDSYAALTAERDRLREALVKIENQLHYVEGSYFHACQIGRTLARTALGDGE